MTKIHCFLCSCLLSSQIFAQEAHILPRFITESEKAILPNYTFPHSVRGIESPPPFENLRTMAEWEEVQAITITWRSFPGILKQIVRAAKEECQVIIFCENCTGAESFLMGNAAGGPLDNMDQVALVEAESNSIWIRDYGANTVYGNRVDTLLLVDWIYNRPRPDDDILPDVLAEYLDLELYSTTSAPTDLVHTGGNFMSDGHGTAWSSELILEENEPGNLHNVTVKSEQDIDQILLDFQGISRFIKMSALQYDIINHIDMHMKILDEQTLLVGEYPSNTADGPQINANIDYVINTFQSLFNTDYKVVRIPMPDSPSGLYPDDNPPGYYRTYTNGVFVNKTYLYPSYREEYDTTAARIYAELLPGYTLVPIDCDNGNENIIASAGAIHCITHSVGVNDPLLITHQRLSDTYVTEGMYTVAANVEHRTGIADAMLHWRVSGTADFASVGMVPSESELGFLAGIPAQPVGTVIEYFISAIAENGKSMSRPIVAPDGFWSFEVLDTLTGLEDPDNLMLNPIYPNPASSILTIPILAKNAEQVVISIYDMLGRQVQKVFQGNVSGDRRLSHDVSALTPGLYHVRVVGRYGIHAAPLLISR